MAKRTHGWGKQRNLPEDLGPRPSTLDPQISSLPPLLSSLLPLRETLLLFLRPRLPLQTLLAPATIPIATGTPRTAPGLGNSRTEHSALPPGRHPPQSSAVARDRSWGKMGMRMVSPEFQTRDPFPSLDTAAHVS